VHVAIDPTAVQPDGSAPAGPAIANTAINSDPSSVPASTIGRADVE
jgi:hypothetical protein